MPLCVIWRPRARPKSCFSSGSDREPNCNTPHGVSASTPTASPTDGPSFRQPMGHFDFSVVLSGEFRDSLVSGFLLSIQLTVFAGFLALPVATMVALCRLSSVTFLRGLGAIYVEGIRNIPLLVHMLLWYFAMPETLPVAARDWLYAHNAESICAVLALTLYTSSYMAEDIRSGIRAVPATQFEAARALGFGYLASMRRV